MNRHRARRVPTRRGVASESEHIESTDNGLVPLQLRGGPQASRKRMPGSAGNVQCPGVRNRGGAFLVKAATDDEVFAKRAVCRVPPGLGLCHPRAILSLRLLGEVVAIPAARPEVEGRDASTEAVVQAAPTITSLHPSKKYEAVPHKASGVASKSWAIFADQSPALAVSLPGP